MKAARNVRIEYVTHASLFLQASHTNLLTDPFYWFDATSAPLMMHFPPRALQPEQFGTIHYVYSSHVHPDHSHPETIALLKDRIETVLLPAHRPLLEERYRQLGCSAVRLLQNGVTVALDGGLEVTSYWCDPVDTCLVASLDGKVVLHLNDCLLDLATVRRIAERHRIDYAFVLYTSAQDLYPFLLPRSEEERQELARVREETFLDKQLQRLEMLQPRMVIPYSMTMTYHQPDQIQLNGYHRLVPPQFRQKLLQRLPDMRCEVVQPGDVIDTDSDVTDRYRVEDMWGETLAAYLANVTAYADSRRHEFPAFDWGQASAVHPRLLRHLEATFQTDAALYLLLCLPEPVIALHVRGQADEQSYIVDLRESRVLPWSEDANPSYLEITMPASLAQVMLDGVYDPFSLLFSHRFTFKLNSRTSMDPKDENNLYVVVTVCLLCPNPQDHITL